MSAIRIAARVAALGALVAGAAWLAFGRGVPDAGGGVAVIGDAAPQIHAAMGTAQALPLHTAALTVVAVADWSRLRYLDDMRALCGSACGGTAALVRVLRLSPGGARKVVLVDLSRWPGVAGAAPSAGAGPDWSDADFACLAEALAAERTALGPGALPSCADGLAPPPRLRVALPAGLGVI